MPPADRQQEPYRSCLAEALRYLARRMHSRAEMQARLARRHAPSVVEATLAHLERRGYLDDARFALARAQAALERHHGRRRAMADLLRCGVSRDVAERAVGEVYAQADTPSVARQLALKHAPRLRKLDPQVARRRLAGMLQRRGFDYDAIKPVIDEVLGHGNEDAL